MDKEPIEDVVRNVDLRLQRVEQILPTLATKDELREVVSALATKDEVKELGENLRAEMRDEGERSRRHMNVIAEDLRDQIRLVAEVQVAFMEKMDRRDEDYRAQHTDMDRRVTHLEAKATKRGK